MNRLFSPVVEDSDIPQIPGLAYLADYIGPEEESRLVELIEAMPWDNAWDRRRQLYGGSYGAKGDPVSPVPPWGRALAERMHAEGIVERPFDHMLVNEYLAGQGIAPHTDYSPFDRTVVSLSLLSPCVMDFRRPADNCRQSLLLLPRSLLVLSDDARYDWQHGIARRKSDRWHGMRIARGRRLSITFRLRKRMV
jgi:alkylated DNA repair dioxygenase AlkB